MQEYVELGNKRVVEARSRHLHDVRVGVSHDVGIRDGDYVIAGGRHDVAAGCRHEAGPGAYVYDVCHRRSM
jgi:hypothetical protein